MRFLVVFPAVFFIIGCATGNVTNGIRHLEQKNYAAAIASFDRAAALRPHPRLYYGYFQAYMGIKNYENALKYLTVGMLKYPNDAWLNLCAGHWHLHKGNDARMALFHYEKARAARFGKPGNIMYERINHYIGMAKDQMVVDSLETILNAQ
ncbi:MAG: tetratricopeptide repeat protein [Chitinispirillaceae bacterium]|nr:tetratricopeptide repeat protein [Chitinispirillaceae bacterium]